MTFWDQQLTFMTFQALKMKFFNFMTCTSPDVHLLDVLVNLYSCNTGIHNRFPFLDILGYLKNPHRNPKFGRVRQVPIRELGWEFPGWGLSHFAKFGILMGIV